MRRGIALAMLAVWIALPFVPAFPPFWTTLANYIGIASIVTLGLVVLTGFGNMTSFGQASFMGFGAYTTALLTTQLGVSPWLTLPACIIASGAAAAIIGTVTLRLSGHYLALGTIAWSVSLYFVFVNMDLFGRNDGISGIPRLSIGPYTLSDNRAYFVVIWIAVALALLLTRNLLDSRTGRAIRSLRGGAAAAASFGVHLTQARLVAFVYAGALAGLAGWLYAHLQRSINPTPFGLEAGIYYLLMAVLGGAGRLPGAVLGAAVVTLLNDRLQGWLPYLFGSHGHYETIVFGLILVGLLQIAPEGMWPRLAALFPRRSRPEDSAALPFDARPFPRRALPQPGTPILQVESLRKTFGGLVAVSDLSFSLSAAELVALIGPNGAGKSTTFNLLTGVSSPTAGVVRLLGRSISNAGPPDVAKLGLARSFQHVKLAAGMSVIENVALGAHLRGSAGALRGLFRLEREEEGRLFALARRQLARVGLSEQAGRPARSLSLGQQRIVEIARALCLDPVLLLLDEPAAGLRYAEKRALAELLSRLQTEGVTILLVEHDMEFVMSIAGRIIVMEFGTLLATGSPEEIRTHPAVIEAYLGSVA